MTFGLFLRQLRKRAGMTQRDLAAALGYSIALISSLEKAQRRPNLQAVTERFIPALGLQDDPHLAASLIEQAALARGERPPASMTFQRTTQMTLQEERTVTSTHLPAPPTLLIGRTAEVTHLCNRLLGHSGRLLTLVGPPGVGKTTLSLAVATQVQHHYRDGAHFIALAAVSGPLVMATSIIGVVAPGDTSAKPPENRLIELLRHRAVLLVLDNLEQIAGAAPLIATILAECPAVTILATSRERLHLRAEQRFKVPPLELPSAVELFVQRAQAVDAAFVLTPENQPTLATICQRLDCLPLAIELSAVQADFFSLFTLLARLTDQPLDLLANGLHDLPSYHQTLRQAIHRSYVLLNEREQELFCVLGIFAGGFDLAAVAHFHFDEEVLQALLHKSLVQTKRGADLPTRFSLLETVREYAYERLREKDDAQYAQQHHAHYYCILAENAELQLGGSKEKLCFDQLALEHDNIRVVLRWSLAANPSIALSLVGSLHEFWRKRGYFTEGRAWLTQALARNSTIPSVARGKVLHSAGQLALIQGDYVQATGYFKESLDLYQQLDEQQGIANSLSWLGIVTLYQNDLAQAKPFIEQGLLIRRTIGDQDGIARSLNNLGLVAMYSGNFDQSKALFAEKLVMDHADHNENGIEITLVNLGYCELLQGASDVARTYFIAGMEMALHSLDRETVAFCFEGLAEVLGLYGETHDAKQVATNLLGAADLLRRRLGAPLPLMDQKLYARTMREIRTSLDDAAFEAAWAKGQIMSLDEVVALAMSQ